MTHPLKFALFMQLWKRVSVQSAFIYHQRSWASGSYTMNTFSSIASKTCFAVRHINITSVVYWSDSSLSIQIFGMPFNITLNKLKLFFFFLLIKGTLFKAFDIYSFDPWRVLLFLLLSNQFWSSAYLQTGQEWSRNDQFSLQNFVYQIFVRNWEAIIKKMQMQKH